MAGNKINPYGTGTEMIKTSLVKRWNKSRLRSVCVSVGFLATALCAMISRVNYAQKMLQCPLHEQRLSKQTLGRLLCAGR